MNKVDLTTSERNLLIKILEWCIEAHEEDYLHRPYHHQINNRAARVVLEKLQTK